jgi:hypothetical protein
MIEKRLSDLERRLHARACDHSARVVRYDVGDAPPPAPLCSACGSPLPAVRLPRKSGPPESC